MLIIEHRLFKDTIIKVYRSGLTDLIETVKK